MITKELICVVCPNGCNITASYAEEPRALLKIEGQRCSRGESWAKQEMENPLRTFSSSVTVHNGDFLEASVRVTKPVPLTKIFDVMVEIRKIKAEAPLRIGDILLRNPAGTDTDVIVTRNVGVKR